MEIMFILRLIPSEIVPSLGQSYNLNLKAIICHIDNREQDATPSIASLSVDNLH